MRPAWTGGSRIGSVASMVSLASRAASAADFRTSRRSVSACVTLSLARLMAAPCVLRSSGDILPRVASRAEIEPFLPSAETRTASSAASSVAAAICPRMVCSRVARSDTIVPFLNAGWLSPRHGRLAFRSRPHAGRGMPGAFALESGRPAIYTGRPGSGGECGLGLLGNGLERCGLVDGEIGQHLAVDDDAGLGEPVDKSAVGQAEGTDGGVEALDPERAEGALLALAVAERILAGLLDRLLGGADGVLAAAVIALGGLEDFLVLGVGGHTAFDARHDEYPSMRIGEAEAAFRGPCADEKYDQLLGRKYFLMLSPSVLNSTRVPRS